MSRSPRSHRERKKPKGYGAKPRPPKLDLPASAIAADPSRQSPNTSWHPPTFYVDLPCRCADRGMEFTFTTRQQKHWYDGRKGSIYSTAKRCVGCRRRVREAKTVQRDQMAASEARRTPKTNP